jgi:hypothetical protein
MSTNCVCGVFRQYAFTKAFAVRMVSIHFQRRMLGLMEMKITLVSGSASCTFCSNSENWCGDLGCRNVSFDIVVAGVIDDNPRMVRNDDAVDVADRVDTLRPAESPVDRFRPSSGKYSGRFQRTMLEAPMNTTPSRAGGATLSCASNFAWPDPISRPSAPGQWCAAVEASPTIAATARKRERRVR